MNSLGKAKAPHRIHVLSWALSLDKDGFIPCHYKNCSFMAMTLDEMVTHFHYSGCRNEFPFTCIECKLSTDLEDKLLFHNIYVHAYEATAIEKGKISELLKIKKEISPNLRRAWNEFFKYKGYLKCLNQACCYIVNSVEEMEDHYLNSCKEDFWCGLEVKCKLCLGRFHSSDRMEEHIRQAHSSGKDCVLRFKSQHLQIEDLTSEWVKDILASKQASCPVPSCKFVANNTSILEKHYKICTGELKGYKVCPVCHSWLLNNQKLTEHTRCLHKDVEEPLQIALTTCKEEKVDLSQCDSLNESRTDKDGARNDEIEILAPVNKKYVSTNKPNVNRNSFQVRHVFHKQENDLSLTKPSKSKRKSLDCSGSDLSKVQFTAVTLNSSSGEASIENLPIFLEDEQKNERKERIKYQERPSSRKALKKISVAVPEEVSNPIMPTCIEEVASVLQDQTNGPSIPVEIKIDKTEFTVTVDFPDKCAANLSKKQSFPKDEDSLHEVLREESFKFLKLVTMKTSPRCDLKRIFDPFEKSMFPIKLSVRKKSRIKNDELPIPEASIDAEQEVLNPQKKSEALYISGSETDKANDSLGMVGAVSVERNDSLNESGITADEENDFLVMSYNGVERAKNNSEEQSDHNCILSGMSGSSPLSLVSSEEHAEQPSSSNYILLDMTDSPLPSPTNMTVSSEHPEESSSSKYILPDMPDSPLPSPTNTAVSSEHSEQGSSSEYILLDMSDSSAPSPANVAVSSEGNSEQPSSSKYILPDLTDSPLPSPANSAVSSEHSEQGSSSKYILLDMPDSSSPSPNNMAISTEGNSEQPSSSKYILPDIIDPAPDDSNDSLKDTNLQSPSWDYSKPLPNISKNELQSVIERDTETRSEYYIKTEPVGSYNCFSEEPSNKKESSDQPFLGFTPDELNCSYMKYIDGYAMFKSKSAPNIPLEVEKSELPFSCNSPSVYKNPARVTSARRRTKAKSFCETMLNDSQTNSDHEAQDNLDSSLKKKRGRRRKSDVCNATFSGHQVDLKDEEKLPGSHFHLLLDNENNKNKFQNSFTNEQNKRALNKRLISRPLWFDEFVLAKNKSNIKRRSLASEATIKQDMGSYTRRELRSSLDLKIDMTPSVPFQDKCDYKCSGTLSKCQKYIENDKSKRAHNLRPIGNRSYAISKLPIQRTIEKAEILVNINEKSPEEYSVAGNNCAKNETSLSEPPLQKKRGRPKKSIKNNTLVSELDVSSSSVYLAEGSTFEHNNFLFQDEYYNKTVIGENLASIDKLEHKSKKFNSLSARSSIEIDASFTELPLKKKCGHHKRSTLPNSSVSDLFLPTTAQKNQEGSDFQLTDSLSTDKNHTRVDQCESVLDRKHELLGGVKENPSEKLGSSPNRECFEISASFAELPLKKKRGRPKRILLENTSLTRESSPSPPQKIPSVKGSQVADSPSNIKRHNRIDRCESVLDKKHELLGEAKKNPSQKVSSSLNGNIIDIDASLTEPPLKKKRGRPKRSILQNTSVSEPPLLTTTQIIHKVDDSQGTDSLCNDKTKVDQRESVLIKMHELLGEDEGKLGSSDNAGSLSDRTSIDACLAEPPLKRKRGRPKRTALDNTSLSGASLPTPSQKIQVIGDSRPSEIVDSLSYRNNIETDASFSEAPLTRKRGCPKRATLGSTSLSDVSLPSPLQKVQVVNDTCPSEIICSLSDRNSIETDAPMEKTRGHTKRATLDSTSLSNVSLPSPSQKVQVVNDACLSEIIGSLSDRNSIETDAPLKKKRGRPKRATLDSTSLSNVSLPSPSQKVQVVNDTCPSEIICSLSDRNSIETDAPMEKTRGRTKRATLDSTSLSNVSLPSPSQIVQVVNDACLSEIIGSLSDRNSIETDAPLKKKRGRPKRATLDSTSLSNVSLPSPSQKVQVVNDACLSEIIGSLSDRNITETDAPLKKKRGRPKRSTLPNTSFSEPFVFQNANDQNKFPNLIPVKTECFDEFQFNSGEATNENKILVSNTPESNCSENQAVSGRGGRRQNSGRIESCTKLDEPNKRVTCAVCEESMTAIVYQKEHLPSHNFVAWLDGEDPLPLDNIGAMVYILNLAKKPYPRFVFKCELCQETRKSAKSYLIHRRTCGRPADPVDEGDVSDNNFEEGSSDQTPMKFTPPKTRKIPDWKSEMRASGSGIINSFFPESSVEHLQVDSGSETPLTVRQIRMRLLSGRIDASTKLKEPKKEVKCAVCGETMTAIFYQKTHLLKHNFMSWLEGEEPLPLDDTNSMLNILNRGKAKYRKFIFTCEICKEGKRSALGFLSHRKFCGTTEEERHNMLVACVYCGRLMMPLSLPAHMYQYHRVESSVNEDYISPGPESIRKAAEKCLDKIAADFADYIDDGQELKNEKNDNNYVEEIVFGEEESKEGRHLNYLYALTSKRPSKNLSVAWRKNESRGEPLKCAFPKCEFECTTYEEMQSHFKTCEFDPPSYSCVKCHLVSKSEEEMKDHVQYCKRAHHQPQLDTSDDESNDKTGIPFLKAAETNLGYRGKLHFFKPAINWTKISQEEEFSQEIVFSEFEVTQNSWEAVSKAEERLYKSETIKSIPVNCNDSNWFEMNSFEGKVLTGGKEGVGFTGGPIWGLAWCPSNGTQYLATAPQHSMESHFQVGSTYNGPGLIQIWTIGNVTNSESSTLEHLNFVYGICHEEHGCWELAWCPGGGETESRLGLLALATTSGTIPVFSVPKPHTLPLDKTKFYKLKPVEKLELPSNEKWQCSAISWCKKKPHRTIVAGFVNGVIGVWDLSCRSSLLRTSSGNLRAYKVFQAHNSFITGICLSPANEDSVASVSFDNTLKFWDLKDTTSPLSISKKGLPTSIDWVRHWMMAAATYDIAYTTSQNTVCLQALRGFMNQSLQLSTGINSTAWSVASNDWLNAVGYSYDNGQVMVSFAHKHIMNTHKDQKKFTKVVLQSTLQELPNANTTKDKSWDSSKQSDPTSTLYKESSIKYGVEIKTDFKIHDFFSKDVLKENANEGEMDLYPFTSINKIAWSPNRQSFTYLAMGYQSGFLVVSKLAFSGHEQKIIDSI